MIGVWLLVAGWFVGVCFVRSCVACVVSLGFDLRCVGCD